MGNVFGDSIQKIIIKILEKIESGLYAWVVQRNAIHFSNAIKKNNNNKTDIHKPM